MLHFILHYTHLGPLWHSLEAAVFTRAFLAALSAFLIMLWLAPRGISWLKRHNAGEVINSDSPDRHNDKSGTPTMGGLILLSVLVPVTLFWADFNNAPVWTVIGVMLLFALLGGYDDYLKLKSADNRGLSIKTKYALQSLLAIAVIGGPLWLLAPPGEQQLLVPIAGQMLALNAFAYWALCYFVLVGSSNAVNLTDGLDGLAVFAVALVAVGLGLLAGYSGLGQEMAPFLVVDMAQASELAIFCAALVGSCLGFLWFNAVPAKVFMGDVGSLSLGAAIAMVAILIRQELALFIMGGLFVIEAVSVIVQVLVFKSTGRRPLRMAPIHHHFELLGWPESHVVSRAWVIAAFFVAAGLVAAQVHP